MADKKYDPTAVKTAEVKKTEPVYASDELAAAAEKVFKGKFTQDIVTAALRTAGIKQATIEEAEAAITKFLGQ